jgi:hypothetical protein
MAKKEFAGKVRVDSRIEALIPPLEKDQLKILEESLLAEGGPHSPLWMWGDLLVDGHHRYKLCKKNKLPFDIVQVYEDAETIEEVEYRIKRDAIGQRNLTPGAQSKFRAEMVAYRIKQGSKKKAAVKAVADESDVSTRQVYRDVERAELVEQVDDSVKEVAAELPKAALKQLAELPKPAQKKAAKKANGDSKKLAKEVEKPLTIDEKASKVNSIVTQHRDKMVRAIDDYHELKPNKRERDRLVSVAQSIVLWSLK